MPRPIDLSRLPPPDAVRRLSFSALLEAWVERANAELREQFGSPPVSEADPAMKWLRTGAYREGLLRQRINDAAEACMLARASGADLEQLAAIYGIERRTVDPGDPDARPPVPPVLESDDSLRRRAQLAPSALSTAGPRSAYIFHALGGSPLVADAEASSPRPGEVLVTVLSSKGAGTADADLLAAVAKALSAEDTRPMDDVVTVQSAAIVEYEISAALSIGSGPDAEAVLAASKAAVTEAAERLRGLGRGAPRSALIAALHAEGVEKVALASPAADVAATSVQSARATDITVTRAAAS